MTRGVASPQEHYYRRVFADAVRAVEAVRALPFVDADRVAVVGGAQGGAISIAVRPARGSAGLAAVAPDVPFLCDIRRATTIIDTDPYGEVVRYCAVHRDRSAPSSTPSTTWTACSTLRAAPRRACGASG